MIKIVLASRNRHKMKELQTLLGEYIDGVEILSLDDVGLMDEIIEDGDTFEENALIKAKYAAHSGYIGVGDDSGLIVDALNGAPGVFSARYAGEHGNDHANNQLLLKNLDGIENRRAQFVCSIAVTLPNGSNFVVNGTVEGKILHEAHGNGGFGYDPLFWVETFDKTLAEVTPEEKNSISHRGKAVRALAEKLKEILKD